MACSLVALMNVAYSKPGQRRRRALRYFPLEGLMGVKGNSGRATGVVVACAVGNMLGATPMVFTVFGLFLVPVATEFGWPRASVSLVLLIVSVAGLVSFPVVGRIIDRYGARWVMLLGTLLFASNSHYRKS